MVLIMSFIGSMLDLARVNMAEAYAYRGLVSAVDAQFSNYCAELYDDYHIFMLNKNMNVNNMSGEQFANSVAEYLLYSFEPDYNIAIGSKELTVKTVDLLGLQLEDCSLTEETGLLDYNGELFQDQVAQYMKYEVASDTAEALLSKLKIMEESKKSMEVIRKKSEMEEKVAKLDKKILSLMTKVEGISFKNSCVEVNRQGNIVIKPSFAKKFCTTEVTPSKVGIQHNVVWDSLQEAYINPLELIQNCIDSLESYIRYDELEKEVTVLRERIKVVKQQIDQLLKEPKVDIKKIEELTKELEQLQEEWKEKKKELEKLENILSKEVYKQVMTDGEKLCEEAKLILQHTQDAILIINQIQGLKSECISDMNEFEVFFQGKKGEINESVYEGMEEEFQDLKAYVMGTPGETNPTSVLTNIDEMKETLLNNVEALETTADLEPLITKKEGIAVYTLLEQLKVTKSAYARYGIQSLSFDYSTLELDAKVESPLDVFQSFIGKGLLELVLEDTSTLSKETLDSGSLVSSKYMKEHQDFSEEETDKLADQLKMEDRQGNSLGDSFAAYEDTYDVDLESSTGNQMLRKVLINEYAISMFSQYEAKSKTGITWPVSDVQGNDVSKKEEEKKETVLSYEKEYLVQGNLNDYDNLSEIIMKTIFIRVAFNYLSLLGDANSRGLAQTTATALVGFTGFVPLITIIKQLILITWAFEEALVDVSGLLQGKEIPFLKNAKEFQVGYTDLLLCSKEMIQTKAKAIPDKGKGGIALSYEDYLRLYLFFMDKEILTYRMMDLIQCNMRKRYDSQFSLEDGIFAAKVKITCTLEAKFLNLPGISYLSGYQGETATIGVGTEYSY